MAGIKGVYFFPLRWKTIDYVCMLIRIIHRKGEIKVTERRKVDNFE